MKEAVSLIRKYLQAGVLEKGVFEKMEKGTPQGVLPIRTFIAIL